MLAIRAYLLVDLRVNASGYPLMHVLVVEDDARIASFLAKGLRAEGYATRVAGSTAETLDLAAALGDDLALVLLDLGLPDGEGIDVLADLRARGQVVPVLPFDFAELLARIRAALRPPGQEVSSTLVVGDLVFDLVTKVARRGERRIDLTPREWIGWPRDRARTGGSPLHG